MDILFNGFTYGGDYILALFNYILLAIALFPFFKNDLRFLLPSAWMLLLVALIIQIVLWFIFYAQGVSVVWNTLGGFLIMLVIFILRKKVKISLLPVYSALVILIVSDIYFWLAYPVITTYAHIASIILGSGLSFLFKIQTKLNNLI